MEAAIDCTPRCERDRVSPGPVRMPQGKSVTGSPAPERRRRAIRSSVSPSHLPARPSTSSSQNSRSVLSARTRSDCQDCLGYFGVVSWWVGPPPNGARHLVGGPTRVRHRRRTGLRLQSPRTPHRGQGSRRRPPRCRAPRRSPRPARPLLHEPEPIAFGIVLEACGSPGFHGHPNHRPTELVRAP